MSRKNETNLYVKNFGKEMTESKLCQLFSVYGTITSCKIPMDNNGQSKGFGFVNFERTEMASNAMEKLNGYSLEDGKYLFVGPFQRKSERQNELRRIQEENLDRRSNSLRLYVSNLDMMVDEKILDAMFSKFGRVTKTHILRNGSQSKGVGFVCFSTIEETKKALDGMNGQWILSKPVYVKWSEDTNYSQLSASKSPPPSIPPAVIPMRPYLNIPTMCYIPAIMFPPPPNHFPLPISPPNVRVPAILEYSSPPPSPPPPPLPHLKRPFYPYIRVKSDDQ